MDRTYSTDLGAPKAEVSVLHRYEMYCIKITHNIVAVPLLICVNVFDNVLYLILTKLCYTSKVM